MTSGLSFTTVRVRVVRESHENGMGKIKKVKCITAAVIIPYPSKLYR